MSAQAISISQAPAANLRPFDMRRDLSPVADLVELCFANSLDADGRLYIRQMRSAARNPLHVGANLPLGGFVWQEDGNIIGNLSLIPHFYSGQRLYLIANVAVHPDHRRRGIARALTRAALEAIRIRGGYQTWLQVDEDNEAAVMLYRQMGFIERMRRTSWRITPRPQLADRVLLGFTVRSRAATDWATQELWLRETYPTQVRWHLPLDPRLLQPGMRGALERALSDRKVDQWSVEKHGDLLGVLSWQSSSLDADRLWLATDPAREDEAIGALMRFAHEQLRPERNLALNYPADRGAVALQRAGFISARRLIWMEYPQ